MNRISRVLVSLTYALIVLAIICTPVVGRAATVATPAFSVAAGSYTGTQSVTLSDATSGATIYYTTNGTTPSITSTKYTGSIAVSTSETIKAIAELTGDTNSAVASAAYTITVPTPAFTPATGTYHSAQSVTLSDATSGATIYYTTNGKTPSSASTKYTGTITVSTSETIQAIAELTGDTNSAVSTATYTFQAPTPTFSLPTGSYAGSLSVTISDANSTATILLHNQWQDADYRLDNIHSWNCNHGKRNRDAGGDCGCHRLREQRSCFRDLYNIDNSGHLDCLSLTAGRAINYRGWRGYGDF